MNIPFILRVTMAVLFGLFSSVHPAFAQMRIKAQDLDRAPDRYYWQQVIIEGEVIDTKHSEGLFKGYYILQCNYGGTVNILSKNLPAVGYQLSVTAVVKPGKNESSFRVEEIRRKGPGSKTGIIIMGVTVAVLGMIIVAGSKTPIGN